MERTPIKVNIGSPAATVNVSSGSQTRNNIQVNVGRKTKGVAPVHVSSKHNLSVCSDKQVREIVVTMQTTGSREAKKLKTARKIEIVGAVSGSTMFDGSEDVVINTVWNIDPGEGISGRILTTDDYASNSDIDEIFG